MNPVDWRKAAALVSLHKQEAATAETDQLNSMPLSKISIDDSGLIVVHYGSHMDNKMNSQKLLIVQKMPLKMMHLTY